MLAAGASSRMGVQKALLTFEGTRLVDRAVAAAAAFPTIVVASPAVASHLGALAGVSVAVNDEPERGMRRSLAIANERVEPNAAIVVLLVDTPLVDAALVARVVAARADADVAFPARAGRGGHPVVFGPRARALIAALPDGDTLRALRDDPGLTRTLLAVDDEAPFVDVDTPADLAAATSRRMV